MKTLLVIDSSARTKRSTTRSLTHRFAMAWRARFGDSSVVHRDLGVNPPQAIDQAWISSAFEKEPGGPSTALAESNLLIDELFRADVIVVGAPMYNFGMPAVLKSYIDQIVRSGRTFDFTDSDENPYIPLVPSRPVVLITSKGSGEYEPGGIMESMNYLEPHLATVLGFIGLGDIRFVKVAREEYKDEQWKRMVRDAEEAVDHHAATLVAGSTEG
jgi:FMN-dependent NADH-azoreductase